MIDWIIRYWIAEALVAISSVLAVLLKELYKEVKSLRAKVEDRDAELSGMRASKQKALDDITKAYDRQIQKEQWKFEKSEEFHKGFKSLAMDLADVIENIDPGWFERRQAAAKPPSELGG